MKITTESGAVYEFTKDGSKFRRLRNKLPVDPDAEVPRVVGSKDGKWRTLAEPAEPVVGYRLMLVVETETGVKLHLTSVVVGVDSPVAA